jgi:hypothetical protein
MARVEGRKALTRLNLPPAPLLKQKTTTTEDSSGGWTPFLETCLPPTLVVPPYLWVGGAEDATDEKIEVIFFFEKI